jgi:hypothetical protein
MNTIMATAGSTKSSYWAGQTLPFATRWAMFHIRRFALPAKAIRAPRNAGSYPGWEELKDLFTKKGKKDPEGRKEWYKRFCANGDPKGLDPYRWSILDVNDALGEIKWNL